MNLWWSKFATTSGTTENIMKQLLKPTEFENLIFEFQKIKVMIDADLVGYGVETNRLKELKKEINPLDKKLDNAFKYLLGKPDALLPKYTERKKIRLRKN
jgi:hypothetical protein